MTKQTTIEAPEGTQTVVITREFDATPEQVFRAHVDPELVVQWLGPDGHTNVVREWDARTGGRWSYVSSDGSGEYGFYGSFHELRPAERIVQTFTFEGWPDGVSLEILELTDLGRGRTRLVGTSVYDSVESRDGMVASGMETGIVQGYDKLDAVLASA